MKTLNFIIACLLCLQVFAQEVTTVTSSFNGSGGLSLDVDGNLYIGDFGDMLGGPDTDGMPNDVLKMDTEFNLTQFSNGFIGASGNGFDNNGVLHQSDIRANAIFKIVDGERVLVSDDGFVSPVGIVFDSNDNFYVCNCGNGNIQKVTPEGISTNFASGSDFFSCPNGITVDENDNLYVSNFSNKKIVKITPSGEKSIIGNTPANNGHLDYSPANGKLYIASYAGNQIISLDIDSEEMEPIAGTGVRGNDDGSLDTATFSTPNGIAVSENGEFLYVNCAVPLNGAIINPQIIRLVTLPSLGINDSDVSNIKMEVYPNPTEDIITLEGNLTKSYSKLTLKIYNMEGALVKELPNLKTTGDNFKQAIDISIFNSGNYFFSIFNGTKSLFKGRFLKI